MKIFKTLTSILLVLTLLLIGGGIATKTLFNELGNDNKINSVKDECNDFYNEGELSQSRQVFNDNSIGVPESLKINTENDVIGEVGYDDFYLQVRKITSNAGIGYCLEIEKSYPHGEVFEVEGKSSVDVADILKDGYPMKSAKELGVDNDDDAYVATQIAIWSLYEGYDVNGFYGEDSKLVAAIKNIYENAKTEDSGDVRNSLIEYYSNNDIQRIVVIVDSKSK